jgi:hypothetical protein
MASPKWNTPSRQNHLVTLFLDSGGFCVYGHKPCPNPAHHYQNFIEDLIADWKTDDRAQASAEWQAERQRLHSLGERSYPLRGQFNNISQDIFFDRQPLFYLVGLSISGLTLSPFAKVRLSSSYVNLFIDLGDALKGVSKNKRRKAIRYGKPLPPEQKGRVEQVCRLAVRHYLNH